MFVTGAVQIVKTIVLMLNEDDENAHAYYHAIMLRTF
jgi:hypothetical protein